jgi:hypothetical protein
MDSRIAILYHCMANLTVYLLKVANLHTGDRHLGHTGELRSSAGAVTRPASRCASPQVAASGEVYRCTRSRQSGDTLPGAPVVAQLAAASRCAGAPRTNGEGAPCRAQLTASSRCEAALRAISGGGAALGTGRRQHAGRRRRRGHRRTGAIQATREGAGGGVWAPARMTPYPTSMAAGVKITAAGPTPASAAGPVD